MKQLDYAIVMNLNFQDEQMPNDVNLQLKNLRALIIANFQLREDLTELQSLAKKNIKIDGSAPGVPLRETGGSNRRCNSKLNYNYFGDTVFFDTVYRTNRYRVPFAAFTGVNHHGQPVLFGCALLLNESESSFIWLFQTWLHAMSGQHPVSITTDPDRLIQVAVAQVLPETRHRYSKQGIFRETQEKMAHIYQSHPTFEIEFKKCISETETIDEFESSWQSLLKRYYVMDNEWLQSMYNARQQWVPVYMRNTFFGEFSVTDGSRDINSFFEGYVNASTTIQMLIKQYEKAVASWHEKELKADYDTANTMPVLKTPSPMEKQAANLYTRKIFMKFQEELVETLANPATKIEDLGTIHISRGQIWGRTQGTYC
ncbi:hypothetical protein GH714_027940 [Hevea brasiliensis]|uniref:Protein FAR1-RELATED SEQUENCE n=1 Tax=Hevea brasiliensis TaxID=3981 RepID=A0A6A6MPX2_HEVBR|nr:hypothetical protein GH714_027940 [Hevea brasiliensis]